MKKPGIGRLSHKRELNVQINATVTAAAAATANFQPRSGSRVLRGATAMVGGPASWPDPSPTYQVAKRNFASKSYAPALATPENAGTLGRALGRRAASPLPE